MADQNANVQMTAADAAKLGNLHSGTTKFGPLTLSWNIDLNVPRITADATLYNMSIGHVVLDTQNPNGKLGGSIGIAKAEVDLKADFTGKELSYDVDVEVFGHVVAKKSGKLFTW